MTFHTVPTFVLDASQDICELVLTGRLDLASLDGYNAAALAHRTFADQAVNRPVLSESEVLRSADGLEAYQEVLAFAVGCIDSLLQALPGKAEWLSVRQECYRTVLAGVASSGQFSQGDLRSLDELIVQRSLEYGPTPLPEASLVLAKHLAPVFKAKALILARSAGAYFMASAVELLSTVEPSGG